MIQSFPYPNITKIANKLSIPTGTLGRWISQDDKFNAKMSEIEQLYLANCEKVVYDAKSRQPYLALQLLQARKKGWSQKTSVSGTITHINFISNIRDAEAQDVEWEEIDGENDTETRENTLTGIENSAESIGDSVNSEGVAK